MKSLTGLLCVLFLSQSLSVFAGPSHKQPKVITSLAHNITLFDKGQTAKRRCIVGIPTATGLAGVCAVGASSSLVLVPVLVYGAYKFVRMVAGEIDCADALTAERLFVDVQKAIRRDYYLNSCMNTEQDVVDYACKRFANNKFPLMSMSSFISHLETQLHQAYDIVLCDLDTVESEKLNEEFYDACLSLKLDIESVTVFLDDLKQLLIHAPLFQEEVQDFKVDESKKKQREFEAAQERKKLNFERSERQKDRALMLQCGDGYRSKYLHQR